MIGKLEAKPISCAPFHDEATGTHHVMRIELKKSGHQVWFGIARDGFGFELEFPSPWKAFLEDFSEIVDSSLTALFEIERSKEKVAKMAEELAVMNIALTTGHLMHQLANKVDEQLFPAESLWEAADRGDLEVDEARLTQIEAILGGARVMKRLVSIFKNVTSTNRQRPCSLRAVVVQAIKFHEQVGKSGITFENKVKDEEFSVDVPYNVALFAIANLVGNSKDAVVERRKQVGDGYVGKIVIEARLTRGEVICYVEDNGSGIPPGVREELYTLGKTGKPQHNGWGLYFTKHSLAENGATIELVETRQPGGTKFRLKFPKAKIS
jgi:signal transduction histidine kinase